MAGRSSFSRLAPMWFTSPRIIRGWFTDIPSWRGPGGTRIPESGLAAPTSRSESPSESVGSEDLDGAGAIGDSIGVADTQSMAAAGTTPGAGHFITGTPSTEVEACAAELSAGAAESTTVAAQPPGLSAETPRRREDTLHPTAKAARARAPSAATAMAERPGAMRHVEAPAWAVERVVAEDLTAVVAGAGNRRESKRS